MFDMLIESGHRTARRRLWPGGLIVLCAHLAVGAAAVSMTLRPHPAAGAESVPVVIPWPQEAEHHGSWSPPSPRPPEAIPGVVSRIVDVPVGMPIGLPPIDRGAAFDPKSYVGPAVADGSPPDMDPRGEGSSDLNVEEPPVLLAAPPPPYPELLRRAGIEGRVVVAAVIDTLGRAQPSSVSVVASPNPGFDSAARDYVVRALFRPARVHGRAVRVLVRVPIDFRLGLPR